MSTGKVLLGVVAGIAVGALAGILLAPDKGAVTRKKIASKGHDLTEGLTEKFNEFLDSINDELENVKEKAENIKTKSESVKPEAKKATSS